MDGTIQRHLGARNNQSAMRNQLTRHKFPIQSFYYPCWHRVLDRRPKNPNILQTRAFQWSLENLLAGARKMASHFKVYFQTDFEHFTPPSGRSIVTESELSSRKAPLSLTGPPMIRTWLHLEKRKEETFLNWCFKRVITGEIVGHYL